MTRAVAQLAGAVLALLALAATPGPARGQEPVVTVLADFETDSVAATLVDARNVPAADCRVERVAIPARGQQSLMIEIGATVPGTSVACELAYRVDSPIDAPQRAAVFCWLNGGQAAVGFRIRDARGRVFETVPEPIGQTRRWQRLSVALTPESLRPVGGASDGAGQADGAALRLPIEIVGLRVTTTQVGHQAVYLDEVQVEHVTPIEDILRADFRFDESTRLYAPGAAPAVEVELENRSQRRKAQVVVDLLWLDARDQVIGKSTGRAVLPPSSADFRSRQSVHVTQRLAAPGLYRLVARVRSDQSPRVREFESSAAVFPSNRLLSRGRNVFFAARSNLLREARPDRLAEVRVAREVGIQMLALDVPWGLVEPSPGQYRLERLDEVLAALAERDIAVMLTISEPPEWLADVGARRAAQVRLLGKLARHAAAKATYLQPLDFTAAGVDPGSRLAYLTELRDALKAAAPRATLVAPPLAADADAPAPPPGWNELGIIWTFQTQGPSAPAVAALRRYGATHKLTWGAATWWQHRGAPLAGGGRVHDAAGILEHYVEAASLGLGALIGSDLRDDSSDARRPDLQRGLIGRDFGPKQPLLGLARTAGMTAGMRYVHALPGAPSGFDTALFVAGTRQTAVIRPKPNRIRPALLAPVSGLAGALSVTDLIWQPLPVLESAGPTLVRTSDAPFFVTIDFERIEPAPRLDAALPWLRVPALSLCGPDLPLSVEIDPPLDLHRSFVQVMVPPDAPFTTPVGTRALRAAAGQTQRVDIPFTPTSARPFERATVNLRVSLEGRAIEVPVELRPIATIRAGPAQAGDACRIAALAPHADAAAQPEAGTLFAAYQPDALELILALPETPGPEDELHISVAALNESRRAEAIISKDAAPREQPSGWVIAWRADSAGAAAHCNIRIAPSALGLEALRPGQTLLMCVRYERRTSMGVRAVFRWGSADGAGFADGAAWVRLAESTPP